MYYEYTTLRGRLGQRYALGELDDIGDDARLHFIASAGYNVKHVGEEANVAHNVDMVARGLVWPQHGLEHGSTRFVRILAYDRRAACGIERWLCKRVSE